FLALGLQGRLELERRGLLAYLRLRPVPDREAEDAKLLLAKLIEDVRLVLALVHSFAQAVAARAALDACVVAGRQRLRAQGQRLAQQQPEFGRLVTPGAGGEPSPRVI